MPNARKLRRAREQRQALYCALLAAGLVTSGMADACTLDALLRLPLEQLLELKVGQRGCSPGQSTADLPKPQSAPRGRP
jgi:hypothetical protein